MKRSVLMFLLICCALPWYGVSKWNENQSWSKHFNAANVEGCFLLYDLQEDKYTAYNPKRVNTSFLPASTFKIFNSLVALETGVIRDENEVLKWDGVERSFPQWNQDHDMRTAFKNSTVWFYQELARRIGQERMQHFIDKVRYGNGDLGGGIDTFWLTGNLRITAKEQIDFLVKLYRNELPFSQRTIDVVKDIFINEKTEHYTLRAKTGWASEIGWWVGYVERGENVYFFALNIDIRKDEDTRARISVTRSILREMKIIETE